MVIDSTLNVGSQICSDLISLVIWMVMDSSLKFRTLPLVKTSSALLSTLFGKKKASLHLNLILSQHLR